MDTFLSLIFVSNTSYLKVTLNSHLSATSTVRDGQRESAQWYLLSRCVNEKHCTFKDKLFTWTSRWSLDFHTPPSSGKVQGAPLLLHEVGGRLGSSWGSFLFLPPFLLSHTELFRAPECGCSPACRTKRSLHASITALWLWLESALTWLSLPSLLCECALLNDLLQEPSFPVSLPLLQSHWTFTRYVSLLTETPQPDD